MSSLLITDVMLDGDRVSILCEEGRIAAIRASPDGNDAGADADAPCDEGAEIAEDVLDGRGCLAHAPLINSHTHAAMTLFRGNGDDLPLDQWLQTRVWPYESVISEEEIYAGTRLGILEMVRSGSVFFNDMYWSFGGVARAAEEMGVRACIGKVLIDHGDPVAGRAQQAEIERLLADASSYSSRVSAAVAPHSIYTVSEESLRWAAEIAADRGLVLHTHLSETRAELESCQREHGCTPVEYLEALGALTERTVAAHTVWLTDHDVELLGERQVVCVHNPVSNMKLAVAGVFPYRKLARAGAVCAIGTDGAGSNNSLDLFQDMKFAALLQKFHDDDPRSMTASEALALALQNPAPVFGLAGPKLELGRPADLILLDTTRPELQPAHSLSSNLVYSATGSVVDSAVCDGKVIMRHRQIKGEDEIVAAASEAARALFERVDRGP